MLKSLFSHLNTITIISGAYSNERALLIRTTVTLEQVTLFGMQRIILLGVFLKFNLSIFLPAVVQH